MSKHQFNSHEEFIRAVSDSKAEYDKKRLHLSWEEKLKILVKLQQKAYAAGKLSVKPWPMKD
ncbi:MAG: hypothetical protein ACKVRP_13790 [Bacteroidota bacterium]